MPERHPNAVLLLGVVGISLSAILVRYSQAPSVITALYRLGWTVLLLLPAVLTRFRRELAQVKLRDGLLCALSDQDFDALLPELRLAFSYFVPMETDRIARQAAALHRGAAGTLRQAGISPAEYSRNEQVDAWAAARLAEEAIP